MNAQGKWKQEYRRAKIVRNNYSLFESIEIMNYAERFRREAALERVIERQQREIEQLQKLLDLVNSEIWHEQL